MSFIVIPYLFYSPFYKSYRWNSERKYYKQEVCQGNISAELNNYYNWDFEEGISPEYSQDYTKFKNNEYIPIKSKVYLLTFYKKSQFTLFKKSSGTRAYLETFNKVKKTYYEFYYLNNSFPNKYEKFMTYERVAFDYFIKKRLQNYQIKMLECFKSQWTLDMNYCRKYFTPFFYIYYNLYLDDSIFDEFTTISNPKDLKDKCRMMWLEEFCTENYNRVKKNAYLLKHNYGTQLGLNDLDGPDLFDKIYHLYDDKLKNEVSMNDSFLDLPNLNYIYNYLIASHRTCLWTLYWLQDFKCLNSIWYDNYIEKCEYAYSQFCSQQFYFDLRMSQIIDQIKKFKRINDIKFKQQKTSDYRLNKFNDSNNSSEMTYIISTKENVMDKIKLKAWIYDSYFQIKIKKLNNDIDDQYLKNTRFKLLSKQQTNNHQTNTDQKEYFEIGSLDSYIINRINDQNLIYDFNKSEKNNDIFKEDNDTKYDYLKIIEQETKYPQRETKRVANITIFTKLFKALTIDSSFRITIIGIFSTILFLRIIFLWKNIEYFIEEIYKFLKEDFDKIPENIKLKPQDVSIYMITLVEDILLFYHDSYFYMVIDHYYKTINKFNVFNNCRFFCQKKYTNKINPPMFYTDFIKDFDKQIINDVVFEKYFLITSKEVNFKYDTKKADSFKYTISRFVQDLDFKKYFFEIFYETVYYLIGMELLFFINLSFYQLAIKDMDQIQAGERVMFIKRTIKESGRLNDEFLPNEIITIFNDLYPDYKLSALIIFKLKQMKSTINALLTILIQMVVTNNKIKHIYAQVLLGFYAMVYELNFIPLIKYGIYYFKFDFVKEPDEKKSPLQLDVEGIIGRRDLTRKKGDIELKKMQTQPIEPKYRFSQLKLGGQNTNLYDLKLNDQLIQKIKRISNLLRTVYKQNLRLLKLDDKIDQIIT